MVMYFSATGNSEFIALEMANRLGDGVLDLLNRMKNDDFSPILSDKPFVAVLPVYVSAFPSFVKKFLGKVELIGNRRIYFAFTSGGYAGISASQSKRIARKKHMEWMGAAEFMMPRNYIASDMFGQLTDDEIKRRIMSAYAGLESAVESIANLRKIKPARHIWLWERLVVPPVAFFWTKCRQSTKPFYASDKCIGCGKCEKRCPLNRIKLVGGKPLWSGKQCAHCMSCIQNCPVGAIEYGQVTIGKKRYVFSKYGSCVNK